LNIIYLLIIIIIIFVSFDFIKVDNKIIKIMASSSSYGSSRAPMEGQLRSHCPLSNTPLYVVILMGVSGSGKTTIGEALVPLTNATFIDADNLHSEENREKMARGEPLTDEDRMPWLQQCAKVIDEAVHNKKRTILACSALKPSYRATLIGIHNDAVLFIHLSGSMEIIEQRMEKRKGHYMPPSLLKSQYETLEIRNENEHIHTVSVDTPIEQSVEVARTLLQRHSW